ncbi:uracil-DNA glycosylase [Knoellia subterranea]|uniref:Type-5 uracil-DNA glycosylase n=1 Tax=Knoellia subterranea KCTC 19937 TaxID=1385521 RepID=A0A0A0JNZ6_9MICO|nr:uracil-DNA glycosylase [Knoellia subterranea]KGN37341.1 uracil-DNA glycosylase [Knoellia subterranea KCTC 19937]
MTLGDEIVRVGPDPHPITGQPFTSPVPPGTGWPGDPADENTPVAHNPDEVRELASGTAELAELDARVSVCRACPRLVDWRETVARAGRRASFADQPYWGRPGPSFGDPDADALIVGLAPAANGTNRTGRMFTGDASGDFLFAALHRTGYANQPTSAGAGDGLELTGIRIIASVRCAPPENTPTPAEKATCATWLGRDLDLLGDRLRVILTLGAIGWSGVLNATSTLGWDVPKPRPKFGHGAEATLHTPTGHPVRLVGCFHVSPHNTYTGRLTPEMLDAALAGLRN